MTSRTRAAVLILLDFAAWITASVFAAVLRYNFPTDAADPSVPYRLAVLLGAGLAVIQIGAGLILQVYSGRNRLGGYADFATTCISSIIPAVVGSLWLSLDSQRGIALTVPLIAWPGALIIMLIGRGILRGARDWVAKKGPPADKARRVLVFGAGEAAEQLIRSLNRSPHSSYLPVALLDDDPAKARRRIDGVYVRGTRRDISRVAAEYEAEALLVAVPSGDARLFSELDRVGRQAGLQVYTLPTVAQMVDGNVSASQIREVDATDILGRHPVEINTDDVSRLIADKIVLVTGAGGSIGSELSRQIAALRPRRLVMLDRDESTLHAVQLSICGHALLEHDDLELADLRDAERIADVFEHVRPEVVFHAAALKHLSLLERNPDEAWKTNVLGTLNVLQAARTAGVGIFINISTDKAANPSSVLGYSKRLTERLTAHFGVQSDATYASVRFGNVLGSRGSMLETFLGQIEAGGPVTVTHPEIARYFMTIPEAVQLVLQAAALASPGEVLVLDMGDEVRIADVAQQLIERSGHSVEIVYTGLRAGEKLHEELLGDSEVDGRPNHPLITQTPVPPLDPEVIGAVEPGVTIEMMRGLTRSQRLGSEHTMHEARSARWPADRIGSS